MIRAFLTAILDLILRVFFRRIEALGLENIPERGPVIFVLNHPNGLVDPLFILCLSPRPVVFLAKSPLFHMPVIGWICRALEAIPVYRQQDQSEGDLRESRRKNEETFARTRELLSQGRAVALFPEGVSHSDSRLRPLKTGAARIALGASLEGLKIVPAGIDYTSKFTFRSAATIRFGAPIEVAVFPSEATHLLTEKIREGLEAVLLQADRPEQLEIITTAERMFTATTDGTESTQAHFERRRRFLQGYSALKARAPDRLAALEAQVRSLDEKLRARGIEVSDLTRRSRNGVIFAILRQSTALVLGAPPAVLGIMVHYPAYRLIGSLATRLSKNEDDMIATIKALGAALFFPLTWLAVAAVIARGRGWSAGCGALVAIPLLGYIALVYTERVEGLRRRLRAERLALFHSKELAELRNERERLRTAILKA